MDQQRRAAIVRESLQTLHRYRAELGASSDAAADEVTPDDLSRRRLDTSPSEDSVEAWKRKGLEFERAREEGRAAIRAEEQQHRNGQRDAAELFWKSVDARISAALDAERTWIAATLCDALKAMGEVADGAGDKFQELDHKLDQLAKLLASLREGNEQQLQRAKERASFDAMPGEFPWKSVN